jgi:hypothetical protein
MIKNHINQKNKKRILIQYRGTTMADLSNIATPNPRDDDVSQPGDDVQGVEKEISPNDFGQKLTSHGFQIENDFSVCDHGQDHTHTLFYQEGICCEGITPGYNDDFKKDITDVTSTEILWRRGSYCESCIDGRIGCLFCGGHYSNLRVFHGDNDISNEYENCGIYVLNPEKLIYEDYFDDWYKGEFFEIIEKNFKENGGKSISITDINMGNERYVEIFFNEVSEHSVKDLETLELKSCSLKPEYIWDRFVVEELHEYWPSLKTLDFTGNNFPEVPLEYRDSHLIIKI